MAPLLIEVVITALFLSFSLRISVWGEGEGRGGKKINGLNADWRKVCQTTEGEGGEGGN